MLAIEALLNNTRSKASCRVQATTSVVDANQLCNKERQPDANRGDECRFVLLLGEHEDSEYKLGCENHLQENSLGDRGAVAETSADVERAWKENAGK